MTTANDESEPSQRSSIRLVTDEIQAFFERKMSTSKPAESINKDADIEDATPAPPPRPPVDTATEASKKTPPPSKADAAADPPPSNATNKGTATTPPSDATEESTEPATPSPAADKTTEASKKTPPLSDDKKSNLSDDDSSEISDDSSDDEVGPRPWKDKVQEKQDGLNEFTDSSDDEPEKQPKKTRMYQRKTKKLPKKPLSAAAIKTLKKKQAAFDAKTKTATAAAATTKRTTRKTLKKKQTKTATAAAATAKRTTRTAAAAAAAATKRTTRTAAAAGAAATTRGAGVEAAPAPAPEPEPEQADPLWDDDPIEVQAEDEEEDDKAEAHDGNEDEEEDDDEAFVEEQPKKRKATAKSTGPKSSRKKQRKAEPKEPRECWPERKVWARPETLKQMMDVTTRGKAQALKKPMETLQCATLPCARTNECEQEKATAGRTAGAVRDQSRWPWNIHVAFHFCEQKLNTSGNATQTLFPDVPELHFWVGSDSASEKLLEIMNGEQEAKIHVHTEFDSCIGHFKRPENKRGKQEDITSSCPLSLSDRLWS